jgi:hypothetical protein
VVKQCLPFSSLFFSLPRESGWSGRGCAVQRTLKCRERRDPLTPVGRSVVVVVVVVVDVYLVVYHTRRTRPNVLLLVSFLLLSLLLL